MTLLRFQLRRHILRGHCGYREMLHPPYLGKEVNPIHLTLVCMEPPKRFEEARDRIILLMKERENVGTVDRRNHERKAMVLAVLVELWYQNLILKVNGVGFIAHEGCSWEVMSFQESIESREILDYLWLAAMTHNVWRKHAAPHRRLRMTHLFPGSGVGWSEYFFIEIHCTYSAFANARASCLRLLAAGGHLKISHCGAYFK